VARTVKESPKFMGLRVVPGFATGEGRCYGPAPREMDLLENLAPHGPRHPWEVRRSSFFLSMLADALHSRGSSGGSARSGGSGVDGPNGANGPNRARQVSVLDCGSGDAWFASRLRRGLAHRGIEVSQVTCWDAHYDAAQIARFGAVYPDLELTSERPARRYDAILMMDVMEHVDDDVAFMSDVVRHCLAPGGLLLLSVPAWQRLYGRHDRFLLHHRRYSPGQCERVIVASGLRVLARGGAFHSLIVPRWLGVTGERLASAAGKPLPPVSDPARWEHGSVVTSLVSGALRFDNAISRAAAAAGVNLPGLTYWALCARADDPPLSG